MAKDVMKNVVTLRQFGRDLVSKDEQKRKKAQQTFTSGGSTLQERRAKSIALEVARRADGGKPRKGFSTKKYITAMNIRGDR